MTERLDNLDELEEEYRSVLERLADPSTAADRKTFTALSRRHKLLEEIMAARQARDRAAADLEVAKEMLANSTGTERELARDELEKASLALTQASEHLRELLVPVDPNDGKNVIVEIRGAEGGEEANIFAKDLFDMYSRYAARRGWSLEILSLDPSELGGINEVIFMLKGEDAWRRMKNEAGAQRVQRVPVTESQGRIHTSSATVTVLPEAEEVDIEIDPSDLKIDVYRSTGPGGQSVNTTDSAVRITHIPTGIVVAMQDEKSQIQNRAKAMAVLRSRLLKMQQDRLAEEQSKQRKSQIGMGGRSDKIRTYNFKENRVTDHRIKLTLHKLDRVLEGELDEISDALLADERARQLREGQDTALVR
ncbi:MAG: peptide chain release factor 1 [Actinobacteria bacterium]|jgi:peptide chain release factor 1|nr:peptide chain release factor 1 [Actinomycetota bacterium]MCL6096026.1 peptide chain release factor 1 [Actinomycetota bacterium]